MKSFTLITLIAAAAPVVLANLTINTPSGVAACEPTQLSWSGGQSPYYLSIVPAGQASAPALENFGVINGTSYTWNPVNFAQGTSFTIELKDSQGNQAFSDIVTVEPGTTNSCVNATGSSGSAPSTTGSGSTAAGASATSGGSSAGETSAGSSASSTASASGSSSTGSSSKSNGAGRLGVSSAFGVTAIMGLIGAALF